jgi:hypothetical protein
MVLVYFLLWQMLMFQDDLFAHLQLSARLVSCLLHALLESDCMGDLCTDRKTICTLHWWCSVKQAHLLTEWLLTQRNKFVGALLIYIFLLISLSPILYSGLLWCRNCVLKILCTGNIFYVNSVSFVSHAIVMRIYWAVSLTLEKFLGSY